MKEKGRGKGKGKPTSISTSVCWPCGKTGHFASNCPNYRVSAVEGEELYPSDDPGDWSHVGEDDWSEWTEWAINAVTELYNDPKNSWDQTWDDQLLVLGCFMGSLGLVFGLYFGRLAYDFGGRSFGEGRNFGEG